MRFPLVLCTPPQCAALYFTASLAIAAVLPATVSAQNSRSCLALGASNLVKNCSFEAPNVPTGGKRWQFTDKIDSWSSTKGWFERWYGHDNFVSDNGGAHLELDVDGDEAGKVKNTTICK